MFKSFSASWLKSAWMRVIHSGWTLVLLVGLSLLLCNLHGRNAFLTWWLTLSGIALIGFSIFFGNLPYRLINPARYIRRFAFLWSWIIWCSGAICLALAPVFAKQATVLWLNLLGAMVGVLFCMWVSRKGLLKWIQ